jgi:REP element-mobilizing transposase RayT
MGAYFVTAVTFGRARLFGAVDGGRMVLSGAGKLVDEHWRAIPTSHPHVTLDAFVVMPDHFHGIIVLAPGPLGPEGTPPKRHGLGEIVRGFKSHTAREINLARGTSGRPFWHRNYYERIIRDPWHMRATRKYVARNPARWKHGER